MVDVSKTVIEQAETTNKGKLYSFEAHDLTKHTLKTSNRFDRIYSSLTLYYLRPETGKVTKNLLDHFKESGFFVLSIIKVPIFLVTNG